MTGRSFGGRLLVALVVSLATFTWAPQRGAAQEKPEIKPAQAPSPKEDQGHGVKMYPEGWVTKVFQLKNTDVDGVYQAVTMFSGVANANRSMRLVMWTGPKDLAPAVEDAVRKLDVVPQTVPNVELTFFLVSASKGVSDGKELPAELEGVAKQLKGVFGLTRLSLLEATVIRARAGSDAMAEGIVQGLGDPNNPARYRIRFDPVSVSPGEAGRVVRLARLSLELTVTNVVKSGGSESLSKNLADLRTDVEFREGQKVVVGKATMDNLGNSLFLVVNGKVVE
jgi:hypothetical protein